MVKLKVEITCQGCTYFEMVEFEFEKPGEHTFSWRCPRCETVRTMTRIIKDVEEKESGNLTRIGRGTDSPPRE